MDNEANIGLVDAHAEGDCSNHDARLVGHEAVLNCATILHAGVVCLRQHARIAQRICQCLGLVARVDVDDATA